MHDFMHKAPAATCQKSRSNCWYSWVYRKLHKMLHRQCSTKKGTNADLTVFVPFWCVPKLLFGNVFHFINV